MKYFQDDCFLKSLQLQFMRSLFHWHCRSQLRSTVVLKDQTLQIHVSQHTATTVSTACLLVHPLSFKAPDVELSDTSSKLGILLHFLLICVWSRLYQEQLWEWIGTA